MLLTTEAIVLNLQRHTDRSHVLHAYTRAGGRINYMVYGAGSKKKSIAQFTPLSLVELTADIRSDRQMPILKESRFLHIPQSMDMRRQSVSLFIAEILYRILRHPMTDEELFQFLLSTLSDVLVADDVENVHFRFLVGFATSLGIGINADEHPELLVTPQNRIQRQILIRQLCQYYQRHIDDFDEPKSLDVLTELFD